MGSVVKLCRERLAHAVAPPCSNERRYPMSYCIMRVEKRKRAALYGLQIEANRSSADHMKGRDFAASDIQWALTDFNMYLVKSENWNRAVTAALKDAEVQERKNSVVVLEGFYGASPEWFKDKGLDEIVDYFQSCLAFHEKTYGKVINAVIHFDEATPHLAVCSPALLTDEQGRTRLSAKDIMGQRADYRRRQDEFYEEVGKPRGMERGEIHDPEETRKHLTVQAYKKKHLELQTDQLKELTQKLDTECKKLRIQNQKLLELNSSLAEQVEQPFLTYCMMEFIRHAKVKGERGEVKLIIDGFNTYMARNQELLRAKWEQQLLPNYCPQQEEERSHEREYEEAEYDDRER